MFYSNFIGDFRDSIMGHMMTREYDHDFGGNVWRCAVCGKTHKSKSLIRDHVEVWNAGVTNFFYGSFQAQHCKTINYTCDQCGKIFKTHDSFKKHIAVHKRRLESSSELLTLT